MDNVTATFKKGKKEDLGNCRPDSLTLVPGKVMEQITLETVSTHMMKKEGAQENGFTKGKAFLMIIFIEMTGLKENERTVDAVSLDLSKTSDATITSS